MTFPNLTRDMAPGTPDRAKWYRLRELPHVDAGQPQLQHLAEQLRTVAMVGPRERRAWRFACLALTVARDLVRFESDTKRTGHEDIAGFTRDYADPLEPLARGADDCDAKARLFVGLCLAAGIPARMVPWWDPSSGYLKHVSGEAFIDGQWVHAETILGRAMLGDTFREVPKEPPGAWRYSQ